MVLHSPISLALHPPSWTKPFLGEFRYIRRVLSPQGPVDDKTRGVLDSHTLPTSVHILFFSYQTIFIMKFYNPGKKTVKQINTNMLIDCMTIISN